MKRKILMALLIAVSAVCFAFGLSACEDKKSNGSNNGSNENIGGNTNDGDTDNGDNSNSHTHTFVTYVSDNNATCTTDGTKTATCTYSGCEEKDTVSDVGSAHGHDFINYVSDNNATCTADGTKTAECTYAGCNKTNTVADVGSAHGHNFLNYVLDNNATCVQDGTKTATCTYAGCNEKDTVVDVGSKTGIHSYQSLNCKHCGATLLSYKLSEDKTYYIVTYSLGREFLSNIIIPNFELGLPVKSIGDGAFDGCKSLTSITIPDSVTSIDNSAFGGCISLKTIKFNGTKSQWKAIQKSSDWDSGTGNYTVICTDGSLDKNGN